MATYSFLLCHTWKKEGKKPSMIGGAEGGFFMGCFSVKNFSGGSPGLLTLPSYIGLDAPMSNFYLACAGAAIAFVVAFVVAYVLHKDEVVEK